MSASSSQSQSISPAAAETVSAVSAADIDASCRAPLLFIFISAAKWLVAGSILELIASLKFHQPNLLANCSWLTYGRIHPAAANIFLYGFAVFAGLGVLLWMACQLGRTRLAAPALVMGGALVWNVAVLVGVLGILAGENTGFEWLEMPRYGAVGIFIAYLLIGLAGVMTFHQRAERKLYISQWFILAALFWFSWAYPTGNLLLMARPVRGVMQSVIDWWYINNVVNVWIPLTGLATSFYLVPKLTNRPLHSHYLGILAFWILIIFSSWGGVPAGAPVPAWLPALSTVAAMLTVVAVLAATINVFKTLCGQECKFGSSATTMFIGFGAIAYLVAGLAGAITAPAEVSVVTNFTWFAPAQLQLMLYGFFAMTMFGAIYHIAPRLVGVEFPKARSLRFHFWMSALGVMLYAIPLAVGGVQQGLAMNDPRISFKEVIDTSVLFLRVSTSGNLLMLIGNLVFLINLVALLNQLRRPMVSALLRMTAKGTEVPA